MGIKSGPNEHKLGIRGSSTTEIFLDDVKVPVENVLGEVGRGFKVAMEVLNSGRLGLASGCVGLASRLIKLAIERVQERSAFGRTIGEFGLIKDKIADDARRRLRARVDDLPDRRHRRRKVADYSLESAICKIVGSETVWRVANEALQIAAGIGYMSDYPYERLLRDARINLIFEGTNEILRCFIALAGCRGRGGRSPTWSKAMREPIKGFGLLSDFAVRKARTALGRERHDARPPSAHREAVVFEELPASWRRTRRTCSASTGATSPRCSTRRSASRTWPSISTPIAACLARTTRAIERRGEDGARREIDLTVHLHAAAQRRLRRTLVDFTRNDDELRKAVASRSYADGAYPFDIL